MNCWHCKHELIWGNDFDLEEEDDDYGMLTTLSCPNCNSLVEVYLPREREEDEGQDQSKLLSS